MRDVKVWIRSKIQYEGVLVRTGLPNGSKQLTITLSPRGSGISFVTIITLNPEALLQKSLPQWKGDPPVFVIQP